VQLREDRGWRLDINQLHSAVDDTTKVIVFNATNMPTGVTYTREELDAISDIAINRDLWVIYEAPTSHLTFDVDHALNIATWPGMRERTIILDGVSKDFNMVAWRIGWAVADKSVMEHIGKAHMYNGTLTSAFAQAGVIALLEDHAGAQAYSRNSANILSDRGRTAAKGLNAIPGLSCVPPDGGWWFLVDHREVEPDDSKFAHYLLEEANVAVTPMGTWGPSTAVGHVRVIFSNEPVKRLSEAVDRVAAAVAKL
jgi:aspartate/methionine/tyrosine aminotransferase